MCFANIGLHRDHDVTNVKETATPGATAHFAEATRLIEALQSFMQIVGDERALVAA